MAKRQISMTIDDQIFKNFKSYCQQNGMKVSSKVELLMKDSTRNHSLKRFLE